MEEINKKFRFRKFPVYNEARFFIREVKNISNEKFPISEKFSLSSQLWRALDSIVLNIAEGSDRGSDKDFAHFLNISHTSLNEVVACLDVALDEKYISIEDQLNLLKKATKLADQITAFRKSLLTNPTK